MSESVATRPQPNGATPRRGRPPLSKSPPLGGPPPRPPELSPEELALFREIRHDLADSLTITAKGGPAYRAWPQLAADWNMLTRRLLTLCDTLVPGEAAPAADGRG